MALAARHLDPRPPAPDPQQWITVDEAAALLRLNRRTLLHHCQRWSAQGKAELRKTGKTKATWHVHRSVDPRLSRCPDKTSRESLVRESLLAKYPRDYVELAYRRARWLQRWRNLCSGQCGSCSPSPYQGEGRGEGGLRRYQTDRQHAADIVSEAKQAEGDSFKISVRTLQMWKSAYDSIDPQTQAIRGVEALVDKYKIGERIYMTVDGSDVPVPNSRSPEAIAYFYRLYRTGSANSVQVCHEETLEEARRRGWLWPKSTNSTRSWLRANDCLPLTCTIREGARAANHRYLAHAERDWSLIPVGHCYIGDHTECDFWVCSDKDPEDVFRPWLTTFMDGRTRTIVGWQLSPSPDQEVILLALRAAFADFGIPRVLYIDNGKDFTAKSITGLTKHEVRELRLHFPDGEWKRIIRRTQKLVTCDDTRWSGMAAELGIEVQYAIPYSPQSKSILERWYRTFQARCSKLYFATYCGNKPEKRPEALKRILADGQVPTMSEARALIAKSLTLYHHRRHGSLGCAPLSLWDGAEVHKALDDQLAMLCAIRGEYRVSANGVRVAVAGGHWSYGASSSALRRFVGRKVLVGVDLERPSECFAYEIGTRRLIGRLESNKRISPLADREDLKEAMRLTQRNRKQQKQLAATAHLRTRDAVQLMNESVHRRVAELQRTGTDDRPVITVVRPVSTGFEGVSMPARTGATGGLPVSAYPPVDLDSLDLSADAACAGELDHASIDISIARFDDVEDQVDLDQVEL